jgi:hypothetical protein
MGLSSPLQISVVRPRPFRQWIAVRLGAVAALMLAVVAFLGVRGHNSAAVIGGLGALGVMAVIAAIEIPLVLRVMARRQQRVFDTAPQGTLFAARVSQLGTLAGAVSGPESARRGLRQGTLLLNATGVSFTPSARRGGQGDTSISWQELSAVRLSPSPGSASARLQAITGDGRAVSWLIPPSCVGTLVQALDGIPAQHRTGPATEPVQEA